MANEKTGTSGGAETTSDQDYEPRPLERAAARRVIDRRTRDRPTPKYNVEVANGETKIAADHVEPAVNLCLLVDMLGSGDTTFADGVLYQLANAARSGKSLTSTDLNTMLATVNAIGPRDPTEALLASQMAAIHNATMVAARRLIHVDTLPQQDSASNMLNKLARTFAAQVEALKKYRATGEQSIRVQHVTVNDGGQAIVGDVNAGGGGNRKRSINLMDRLKQARAAPRCSATAKHSRQRCQAPTVKGWRVCRFHGARSGAPTGKRNGRYRHGMLTNEVREEIRDLREMMREARAGLEDVPVR